MSVTTYGWLVLAFPLGGSLLIALTYRALPQRVHGIIGTLAILLSFLSAVAMFFKLQDLDEGSRQVVSVGWDYAKTVGIDAQIAILVDPLSTLMCLVVAGVSTLIHLYSVAYMGGDRGYTRFFAYLNFFVFSMLLLVLASNFFLLIIGWAFVGPRPRPASRRSSSTCSATSGSCSGRTSSSAASTRSTSCRRSTGSTRRSPSTLRAWWPAASCC
jgi:NADH-quinone oxidoreductase subunit L